MFSHFARFTEISLPVVVESFSNVVPLMPCFLPLLFSLTMIRVIQGSVGDSKPSACTPVTVCWQTTASKLKLLSRCLLVFNVLSCLSSKNSQRSCAVTGMAFKKCEILVIPLFDLSLLFNELLLCFNMWPRQRVSAIREKEFH